MNIEKVEKNPVRVVGKWLIAPVTNFLANQRVEPNTVSKIGEKLASAGVVILMNQDRVVDVATKHLGFSPTKARWGVRIVGGVLWLAGIICDAEDGDLAEKTNKKTSFGKWLDAVIDRRVDLLPWPYHRINSHHPADIAVAEINQVVDSVPALLKTIKPDVPELSWGSRFPRLLTLTGFLLFPKARRLTGSILALQAIATGYARYKDIEENGTDEMILEARDGLTGHMFDYLRSKLSPEGILFGFSTRRAMIEEYAKAKRKEIKLEDPSAIIPESASELE